MLPNLVDFQGPINSWEQRCRQSGIRQNHLSDNATSQALTATTNILLTRA